MKAVLINSEKQLAWSDIADPVLKPGYVTVNVKAAGVNRADLLQVAGKYPPPPDWPDWPGLECSGVIAEVAEGSRWKAGDKVCASCGLANQRQTSSSSVGSCVWNSLHCGRQGRFCALRQDSSSKSKSGSGKNQYDQCDYQSGKNPFYVLQGNNVRTKTD